MMNKKGMAASLLLLAFLGLGLSSPPCTGVGFRAASVGATGAVIGASITTLPQGRTCISMSGVGSGTFINVYLATFDRTGAIEDSTTVPVPVGGSFEKYFRDGVDSLNVTSIAAGDTLLVEVSS